jgi:integrase
VGESKAPTRATQLRALKARLKDGESLGAGTVRESWQGRAVAPDGRRLAVYAPTREEAARKLAQAVQSAEHGQTAIDARLTVGAFLGRWLAAAEAHVRPRTWEAHESATRVHLVPALGRIKLVTLTAGDVDTMLANRLKAGLSPGTVNRMRAVLRVALGQAVAWRLVTENVVKHTKPVRSERHEPNPLTAEQGATLLAATAGDRLNALWCLALGTGMRQGECLALTWPDINLDAGTARIRHSLQPKRGSVNSAHSVPDALHSTSLAPPKSERSRRTVNLPTIVVAALRAHRARQGRERLARGGAWAEGDFVFAKPDGQPLDGPWVTKQLQRALADAGLPRQRFHDLRHTAASLALEQGVSLREVMELLGHSSITLTANTYGHIRDKAMRNVADKLDAALSGAS